MGFFRPGNSRNQYLGIWYKKISLKSRTVVWVANREIPLINSSGVLTIINPGILALVNGTGTVIWSVNVTESTQNPIAQLMDTGNLVVKDANDESENFLWQSFDYPCDTQLPGMKLGKNFETGLERHITPWRSSDDPAQGDYKYQRDPQGYPQNILSYGSVELFRTGPWNGIGFSGTPNVKPNPYYTYGLHKEEAYYHYALLSPVLSRYDVSYDGHVRRWIWVDEKKARWEIYLIFPTEYCDTYNLCGPNGNCQIGNSPACGCLNNFVPRNETEWRNGYYSNGCVRRTPLDCRNGDDFLMYSRYKMPDTRNSWFDTNMTLGECKMRCLKICSCTAYTNLDIRGDGSGCLLWFNELIDMREFSEDGPDIYLRMASSGLGIRMHNSEQGYTDKSQKEDLKLPLFDLAVIANSTNNFSINNKIGEGGFGAVYKGIQEGGQEIAVKRLSKNSSQRLDEFKNEVICINKLQHRNLVKLLGCYIQGEETMLIYEYMPNKSLDYFIFGLLSSKL
ncbi:G-type lectin S-receptor-like serine/threonine-protein kinase At4g27290 [Camellia sinensis]|uniref:G-type lectin S-receptor-like serine/threonine-protein kinase At4g27290 n=1 Tax=Camellia sinensis TaxID=4442 RepID=UPI0010358DC2|nr:G-type lectin S-receptor-like serine/threonine-protein kinase At4g27290 [Camellia sinensis]